LLSLQDFHHFHNSPIGDRITLHLGCHFLVASTAAQEGVVSDFSIPLKEGGKESVRLMVLHRAVFSL
jgi:hypothetical protein